MMQITNREKEDQITPILRQAFRPLFLLGALFSALAILLWGLALAGEVSYRPNYNLQTFDYTWLGEYHDLARFLAEIASFERILTPTQLQLVVPNDPTLFPDYEAPVQADFTIMTYVLPPPGQTLPTDSATVGGG